jgi:hypothetical protein
MKKFTVHPVLYIFILILLLSTGCKKEDAKPEGLTIQSLYGSWTFMTLYFNGKTTYSCDSVLNKNYDFVTLDFYGVSRNIWNGKSEMLMNTGCLDIGDAPWQKDYSFTFVDSVINCNDEWEFKLLYISPFEYTNALTNEKVQSKQMAVKLIYSSFSDVPINGIYTLGKTN